MTLGGYTYQIGDLFTTSKTGITGRIEKFVPQTRNVTKVMLRLANGQQRFAMVKTHITCSFNSLEEVFRCLLLPKIRQKENKIHS